MRETEEKLSLNIHIRPANIADAKHIEDLLIIGAEKGSVKLRSEEEIKGVIDGFVVMDNPEKPGLVACASVEIYDKTLAELRSVVSLRHGAGSLIVARALKRPNSLKIRNVFATTDNTKFFIEECKFRYDKGGKEIAWMDLDRPTGTLFEREGITVRDATYDDVSILTNFLTQDEENVLPMDKDAIEHAIDDPINSLFVAVNPQKQILGCAGAFVYSSKVSGGRPRMAEVKGLMVRDGNDRFSVQNALLERCFRRFKETDVVQAFITGTSKRRQELIESGYFSEVKGGKQVLWWDQKTMV